MAQQRNPKRARKKERREQRRDEWRAYVKRRRRQRWGVLIGSLAVVGVGVAVAFFVFQSDDDDKPQATASASASPKPGSVTVPEKKPVACDADLPDTAGSKKKSNYASAKDQNLDPDTTYIWHLETSCGDVDIELDVEQSPKTSNSIVFLTREGFYDGTFFHRLVKDFVAQGGDPTGTGTGGAGYQVVEPPPEDIKYAKGVVAMAKAGTDPPGASDSQFFIVVSDRTKDVLTTPDYALVGEVVDGLDAVDDIVANGHAADGVPPEAWVYIERATIVEK